MAEDEKAKGLVEGLEEADRVEKAIDAKDRKEDEQRLDRMVERLAGKEDDAS